MEKPKTMAEAVLASLTHPDPAALAREIMNVQLQPLICRRRPANIAYVVVGKHLPPAAFDLIRQACATLDYAATCERVGDRPDSLRWLVSLGYTPANADGDREPLGQVERID